MIINLMIITNFYRNDFSFILFILCLRNAHFNFSLQIRIHILICESITFTLYLLKGIQSN